MKKNLMFIMGIGLIMITATEFLSGSAGTASLTFLKIAPSARPAGMGGAFVGLADDADAVWFNIAGITNVEKPAISANYSMLFQGLNYQYVVGLYPLSILADRKGTAGLCIMRMSYGDLKGRDIEGRQTETFTAGDILISASYGLEAMPKLFTGLSVKIIQSQIEKKSAGTFAIDAGALYNITTDISAGLSIRNLGGSITYDKESSPIPAQMKLGASYKMPMDKRDLLKILGDVNYDMESGVSFSGGAEYTYKFNGFSLTGRTGYKTGIGVRGAGLTFGGSVEYKSYRIDVAFVPFGELGNVMNFGVQLIF